MIRFLIIYLIAATLFFSCTPTTKEPNACRDCQTEERILKTYDNGQRKLIHHYENCCGEKKLIKKIKYYEGPGNNKLFERSYNDTLEDGEWIEYYKNGQKKSISRYKNGLEHGKFEEYYENRQLRSLKEWKNGQKHGDWIWYRRDGRVEKRKSY